MSPLIDPQPECVARPGLTDVLFVVATPHRCLLRVRDTPTRFLKLQTELFDAYQITGLGSRKVARCLYDMKHRKAHSLSGHKDAVHYAEAKLGMSKRSAQGYVNVGMRLEDLEQVRRVIARDNNRCQNCNDASHLQVHHVEFREDGGQTEEDILATLCSDCHSMIHQGC